MTFLHEQPEDTAVVNPSLKWKRSSTTWRQEWTASFDREGYYVVAEQPGQDIWSVNYYDHKSNVYAVNGMVLASSLAEAQAACERDATERRVERSNR